LPGPEPLGDELARKLRTAQSEWRLPSVATAVFRGPEVVWEGALGVADAAAGEEATTAHAYRIGSITKTFTAVCVMQLRDESRLELDSPLRTYLPEMPPGPTVRHALAHLSGLQREPPGEIWETMQPPSREQLIAGLEDAERVLAPGERWHYSNLAYGLLGEVVARLRGGSFPEALQERVLAPLGLGRTRLRPEPPSALGYFVEPYSDSVRLEPDLELTETTAALGQLWSTVGDLARWGSFLAAGDERVLVRETLDEMARVAVMADHEGWRTAWGLGLGLYRRGERVFAGHGGAMPGFLAFLGVSRADGVGAAVLTNTGAQADPQSLALDLAETVLERLPDEPKRWSPDAGAPPEVAGLLGRWWTEGDELVVTWRDGRLRSELVGAVAWNRHSTFEPEGPDRWRCVEGRERGELLRAVRDEDGTVLKLYFATYPCAREPSTFGERA
jgi:CubicO group peptidase (beta-lactamase class C family)